MDRGEYIRKHSGVIGYHVRTNDGRFPTFMPRQNLISTKLGAERYLASGVRGGKIGAGFEVYEVRRKDMTDYDYAHRVMVNII